MGRKQLTRLATHLFFIALLTLPIPYKAEAEDDGRRLLTREDFCVLLAEAFYEADTAQGEFSFADDSEITQGREPYIYILYESGVLSGRPEEDGVYLKPNEIITRQEAFTLLGRVLNKTSDTGLPFTDAESISPWAYAYIAWFAENGIASGYPDGRFGPMDSITSGQADTLISKMREFNSKNSVQITSFSGTGNRGLFDGTVGGARFTLPYGVTANESGVVIIFDTYNNAIRKISGNAVETLTGSSTALDEQRFFRGRYLDGALSSARLNRPTNGAYNPGGDLLICDGGNSAIRVIRGGEMYTFSGSGEGYMDGPAKTAKFNNPQGIALDGEGNVYVADTLNNCIRKLDKDGNAITIAGKPGEQGYADGSALSALFANPSGIAVSGDGSVIFVADTSNHRIRKIENGQVTTLAGQTGTMDEEGSPLGGFRDGPVSAAMFNQPLGIAYAEGVLIVADSGNNRIRAITPGGTVVTLAGSGEPGDKDGDALSAELNRPSGVFVAGNTLYIADTTNNKIKLMTLDYGLYR